MAFLHADADSHCIYGMQRYGPTERAVALWGHEIAFSVLCTLPFRIIELTKTLRLFPPRPDVPFVLASLTVAVLQVVSPVLSPSSLLNRDTEVPWGKRSGRTS